MVTYQSCTPLSNGHGPAMKPQGMIVLEVVGPTLVFTVVVDGDSVVLISVLDPGLIPVVDPGALLSVVDPEGGLFELVLVGGLTSVVDPEMISEDVER